MEVMSSDFMLKIKTCTLISKDCFLDFAIKKLYKVKKERGSFHFAYRLGI